MSTKYVMLEMRLDGFGLLITLHKARRIPSDLLVDLHL